MCDSNTVLKLLNQNWTTENHNNLKEKIKSLNESLKETIKDYHILKENSNAENTQLKRDVKTLDNSMIAIQTLENENDQLIKQLKIAKRPWYIFY